MHKIVLDPAAMPDRAALHLYLKEMLSLPDYYGENLDALYDCLTDISVPTEISVPACVNGEEHLGRYGEQLLRVLSDAAEVNENLIVHILK